MLNYNECEKTAKFLDDWISNLKYKKKNDYINELLFEYRLIKHALNLNLTYLRLRDFRAGKKDIEVLLNDLKIIMKDYKKIWNKVNKKSDFKYSMFRFEMLKIKYLHYISLFEKIERL